jgi:hypothetical protein
MSNNIQRDIFSRFEKKIAARTASTRSGRFDLRLSDYEVLSGKREARVLVAYASWTSG